MNPWLAVVGIGEDGLAGLSPAARTLIETAAVLVGGERHLAMLPSGDSGTQERLRWSAPCTPLAATVERIVRMRGRRVAVLTTGDPMHFGAGATLARHVAPEEMTIVPSPSAFSLAAARLGWPLDRVTTLSVHGRPIARIAPHIQPGARLLILTSNGETPREVAAILTERGFGESRMVALAHMGGAKEARTEAPAHDWSETVPDLNTLAVECVAAPGAVWHPRVGLADDAFQHDGKLTKREVRASAIAKLMPHPGALLIDIGAGCGSVAIEWMRAEPNARAIALEPRADRRAMAAANAAALGAPDLDIRDGTAPWALTDMPAADAVFVGGGVSEATIAAAGDRLKPGGRLVAHAVTLESEAVLLESFQHLGGDLTRLAVTHAEAIGGFHGWRPSMPVTQWAWVKT
jgi:precorrin-6Y C5,15-methyltransferase (decarboxylating)